MSGGGLIQLLTIGLEDAPLILNPEITFFKTVYRKHTNFSIEQIVKNIGIKKFDCFHQFKIDKVTDLLSGLHFIIDIPYFDVLKTVTSEIITKSDIININEFSVIFSNIKTYLFFESSSQKYYLIPENFFNLSENDNYSNHVSGYDLEKNLLNKLEIINSLNYGLMVDILALKKSTLNQILPVLRLNFGQWTEFWLKIINKKENFNYFTRLISQLSLVEELSNKINLIIFDKFNNYNIFYEYKENLNFTDEIKNYYYLGKNIINNPIYDTDFALNYTIKNNLDISKCKLETLKFNSLFLLFLLQTLYPDFTSNVKSFTFWKKYNLNTNNIVNDTLPIISYNYFLEWINRFDYYKKTSYGDYEKLNIEIYENFSKKYTQCETNINLLFNTIDIKQKEKLWCILYAIYLRFNNKDIQYANIEKQSSNPFLNKICFDDFFVTDITDEVDLKFIEQESSNIYDKDYKNFSTIKNLQSNWTKFDEYNFIQPVDLSLIYVYLCYKYLELIVYNNIFDDNYFLILWRNKINIAYFFRTIDNLDNFFLDKNTENPLINVFTTLHDYNDTNKKLTFYHNINLTRDINLDIIRDELIKTVYSESFYGTIDIEQNSYSVNTITMSSYTDQKNRIYSINNQNIVIYEELTTNYEIKDSQIIIKNWNRNIFNEIYIKNNGLFIKMDDFEIKDNTVYITYENLFLINNSKIDIQTKYITKIPIVNIKDENGYSLCNTTINDNRILLFESSNNSININNINNKQIFCNINYNKTYFYQLNIQYINGTFKRINVDFSNNYFVSEIDLNYNKITKINLDIIDVNLTLLKEHVLKDDIVYSNLYNNYIIQNFLLSVNILEKDIFWLIATKFKDKKISKEIFIPVKLSNGIFHIYGDISAYTDYSWSLYVIYHNNQLIPNLFSILHHETNYEKSKPKIKYSLNQYIYQQPMIFKVSSTNNIPLYIFYNINMTENATIEINNKIVKKICPINSGQFYRNPTKNIPVMFEFTNLKSYQPKSNLIVKFIEKFNETFINNIFFGNIIKLLEDTNNLYKDLIINAIKVLKKLGKSIGTVIDTSKIINELNLIKYNNRDFDRYSVLVPKFYNIDFSSFTVDVTLPIDEIKTLGGNTIFISSDWFLLTQIKDVYTPKEKISTNLSNYLKNVSNTMLKHIEYLDSNEDFLNIFNKNQYQEKYDYKYVLENEINNNIFKNNNYIIETLYDMNTNYSNDNTEIYFNNKIIDISTNNFVSDENLFEINNEKILFTEKFSQNIYDYSIDKFNYLGSIEFKNRNFNFNNNISNVRYLLTDDLKIIDLSNTNLSNLKTYNNSYNISLSSINYIDPDNTTKYIYEVILPDFLDYNSLNNGILILGNYYNLFKNTNFILVGDNELKLTTFAIIGNSNGNMSTFIPSKTIKINNIKILNGFKSNIKIVGTYNNKIDSNYNFVDCINNGIDTYYSIYTVEKVGLYDFIKIQLLPPFNIVNKQICYNYDNKNFIIENFNNNYWFKLDNNIIQGHKLKDLTISGNLHLSLYPNKFLKLIDVNATATISNKKLYLSHTQLPNYSYYYIDNYVYYIKEISSICDLTDALINNTISEKKVYLLDDSNFKKKHSQYISIIDSISSETILPSIDINETNIYGDFCKLASPNYGYDYKNKKGINIDNELDLYVNFSINNKTFIRPINFTSNTNIIKVNLNIGSDDFNNFLFYKQSDLSNNTINGTITNLNSVELFSSDSNFDISQNNFTLTSKEGIQKYKLTDAFNNYTYVWTLLLDDSITNYDNVTDLFVNINDPININIDKTLIVNLTNYNLETTTNLLFKDDNKLYFINNFENINRQQIYYNTNIIDINTELDLYVNFSINNKTFIRPINFTSNTNIIKVNLNIGSQNFNNFLFYKQRDLSNNTINGTITNLNSVELFSSDSNFNISQNNFTLTSKEGIQKYKLTDAFNNYTYVWTLLLDDSITNYDNVTDLFVNINDPININAYKTLIVNLTNYNLETTSNLLDFDTNNNLYFVNNIINKYALQKLEYNYNSSDIFYCKLEDIGTINKNDINGNQIIVSNFITCKYIILIDADSNYKYCNVLASDEIQKKIILDDEIESKLYNVYGFKRNLILTKNKINIWKSPINYYMDAQQNSLYVDDIIMIYDNIFRVIGLNSFKNIYEIELIRQYNNIKLWCDGYYILYSKNQQPIIPNYEPVVSFTYGDVSGYKFNIDSLENMNMNNNIGTFCIKEGNNIVLYYEDGKLYNPFNYLLNNGDYIVYNNKLYQINFISNDVIYLVSGITDILLNNYYQFYYPFQPCVMENLIFDNSGILTNYYQKNIDYYFEFKKIFIKSTNELVNISLYTRVLKLPKQQYYFENKKNSHIDGTFNKTINGTIVNITENLSSYEFFFNQPILVNNIIKFIKNIKNSENNNSINFTVTDKFNNDGDGNDEKTPIATNIKIYFGKINTCKLYSNYLLDKANYLKPELNLGMYHNYYINSGKIDNYNISNNYSNISNNIIFKDNIWLNYDIYNFLNLNKSYHILLEKTVNHQYVSHLCQIEFPNKLKLFTLVENYNSTFYLNKIYPIKLNVNNTFEYLDLVIYKQQVINNKPSNKIEIWKKFKINVTGLIETTIDGYRVQVEIGNLSNYINNCKIYIDKIILCNIELVGSYYYLKTIEYPGEFENLYTKEINYITKSTIRDRTENVQYITENNIFKKEFGLESIKLPILLTNTTVVNNYLYNFRQNLNYIPNLYNNIMLNGDFSVGDLNLFIQLTYIDNFNNNRVITTNEEVFNNTVFYINNNKTNIFDKSTIQNDIENILEEIIFETDFYTTILFNKIKTWNTWSILTNPETEKNQYLINGPLTFNGTFNYMKSGIYFTNSDCDELKKSFMSDIFKEDKDIKYYYTKIKYYQEKLYEHLNVFFKYSNFWQDPINYINNFALDINSEILFDGTHMILNNIILDDIIINNQFDITFNLPNIFITRNISLVEIEIFNFINNKRSDILYGVKILDVLKELVKISVELKELKYILKNCPFETKNFGDLILNVLKNDVYGKLNNFDSNLDKLKKSLAVSDFTEDDVNIKDNIITYDSSYNSVNMLYEYPTDTYKIMNLINIPYDTNYSIDTDIGLYPYKITLFDEKYKSYTVYKLDFLSGSNTIREPITIKNPIVYNRQINFHFNENFDINSDFVISSFKTYDVSSTEFLGYLYQVKNLSINLKDFATIKYKKLEFTTYDDYLIIPIYLESFTSYIQAETPVGVYDYKYNVSNNKTIITLIKLNIDISIQSTEYISYYYDNSVYYKITNVNNNIITVDGCINDFYNPKIVITIKSPNDYISNKTKIYRLTLSEPLTTYAEYINFKNVPNNFLINNEIKVSGMRFITDSIVDVLVEFTLDKTYEINNIVHYAKIGENPPEPIKKINKEEMYLYRFNNIVPFKDIFSCFILYNIGYNKVDTISGKIKDSQFIDDFVKCKTVYNYNLSHDIIQDTDGIKFLSDIYLSDYEIHNNVFGGVINSYNISNYIYDSSKKLITFDIPKNLVIYSDYYYNLNNIYLDISNISIIQNKLIINWENGPISGNIIFKQIIIEKNIIKPKIAQIYNIELFDNVDLNVNGYLQTLDNSGNEIGQFVYKIINKNTNENISINDISNSYEVLINNSNMLKGTILYKNPLCIVTNELIEYIYTLTIVDTGQFLTDISVEIIQYTYIPYEIYKSYGLKNYKLLIQQNNIFNTDDFEFLSTDKNKYSIIGKYANFKLEKIFQNQILEPTKELVFNFEGSTNYIETKKIEKVKFNSEIYRNIFENIDFCIGEQVIERLDKTTLEIQYQFLKDSQKKKQIDKVTNIYEYEDKMRLIVPLEFWFNSRANMYLPLISLPYTDVSIKFKLNKLSKILGSNYIIQKEPDINIQVNIDGIILDTFEREMFASNKHEYLIERFVQYPDNLIDKQSLSTKMIFKNPVKDIFYKTEISNSSNNCYYNCKVIIDDWQKEYKNNRLLYDKFIQTNIYTNDISNNNSQNFDIIRISIIENMLKNSDRFISFSKSYILTKYDMEMTLYLDEKYQKNIKSLSNTLDDKKHNLDKRKHNLELYYTKIYKYKEIKIPISTIDSMVIKANGADLFREFNYTYFNKLIPYQKYLNSVDDGYYVYSFAITPIEEQPSGHLNFSLFDDIVLKTENNIQVLTNPVILKTIVREYNLLRIMSGLSSLAWSS